MTFRDQRLDPKISFGAVGGPTFQTIISVTESGDESREGTRSKDLGSWDLSYAARLPVVWKPLRTHFLVMGGRRDTWPFKDWLDYQCASSEVVLAVITANTTWQIYKRYTVGSITYDKKIVLPVGTLTVAGGGTYTVGRTTGIITRSAGANPTGVADFEFDKLVRYDTDEMKAVTIDKSGDDLIVGWSGIPVKEVRG